jgi:hypothetical protein
MRTYHGSCHCGAVRFEVEADLSRLGRCTCSICRKKGILFVRATPERFRLLLGADDLVLYQFNKKIAKHYFCRHCGIHPFGHPRAAPELYLVNVNCLDDFDVNEAEYEVGIFDGRDWEAAFEAMQKSSKRL